MTRRVVPVQVGPARLRIHVRKGVNLAIRDSRSRSSDPYVIIQMGRQVKTFINLFSCFSIFNSIAFLASGF
jgi:hypothetical protein